MLTCAAQQLSVRKRRTEPTAGPSLSGGVAPSVRKIDPFTLSAAPATERRGIEMEIAKLLATLSAGGVAAVAALGQAKALNLTIVGICTILLMASLAFSLKSLFSLYAQARFIARYNCTSSDSMPTADAASELRATEQNTVRGLKFAAIWFGASVLTIAIGATAVSKCTSQISDPGLFDYFICSGISKFQHTTPPISD